MHSNPGEEHNPKRQYHGFRPRQASRGAITITTPVNSGTLALFNNGPADAIIVVRDFVLITTVAHLVAVALVNASLGAASGAIVRTYGGGATPAGQLQSLDTATLVTADYYVPVNYNWAQWNHDLPFQFMLPGWSLQFQDTTAAETMRLAIYWEVVNPDQIDFMDAG
jgi:hypothetical protein